MYVGLFCKEPYERECILPTAFSLRVRRHVGRHMQRERRHVWSYGVASVIRIDPIIGLFCKRALLKRERDILQKRPVI